LTRPLAANLDSRRISEEEKDVGDAWTTIVVGATGGIGSHVVRRLAQNGSNIVLVYRSAGDKAAALCSEIEAMGAKSLPIQVDMTDEAAAESVVRETIERFDSVDALINTQGWLHELKLFHEDAIADIKKTVDVELWSVIYSCRAVIPHMIRQQSGRIVTIGSDSGKVGATAEATSAACRGAVIALSKTLARELARHNINVNVVCPGPIDTDLLERMRATPGITGKVIEAMVRSIPMGRLGRPEEVAELAVFLAAGASTYITGQAISVSGGLTMC
jgi:NAD(P)-dependent dehydrogenase (short-subunit alcohol dehydrogenase family)